MKKTETKKLEKNQIHVVCAWCNKDMDNIQSPNVSHSICKPCSDDLLKSEND